MPLRERQEVEEMSRPAGVTAANLKPAAEQLCLGLQWVIRYRDAASSMSRAVGFAAKAEVN